MLGPIEELLVLVVLALVALRFFEDACVALVLVLVLVHEVSASASAASAALACSAAVLAVPVVPVPVLVPALVELVELVLAELFSVAPAGSLGLVDDIGAEEVASAWLPEGLVHPPVGGLEQMEPPGQQKTCFAIVFSIVLCWFSHGSLPLFPSFSLASRTSLMSRKSRSLVTTSAKKGRLSSCTVTAHINHS